MEVLERFSTTSGWCVLSLLSVLITACAGGRGAIPGAGGGAAFAPKVTAFAPADASAGDVAFTPACAAACTNPTGTVGLDATQSIARFTLIPATDLEPVTLCTATLTGVRAAATGIAPASPYVWCFTTAEVAGTAAPMVNSTNPIANNAGVAVNLVNQTQRE